MKLLLLITLLFTMQAMATSLTKLEKAEATLEFYIAQEKSVENTAKIVKLSKVVKNIKLSNELKAHLKKKAAIKHNALVDKEIEKLDKIKLNDKCLPYMKQMVEVGKFIYKKSKKNNSCYSQYEYVINGKGSKTPFTHQELIAFFDSVMLEEKAALEKSKM